MASLIELEEFKHHIFTDPSDLQVFEDLLGRMELPTPPLSPDHADATDSSQLANTTQEDLDVGDSILFQMMASSDDIMAFDDGQDTCGSQGSQSTRESDSDIFSIDPNILLASNPQALLQDPQALLQDCMWNCDAYEPRHSIGIYTPAPSPECKEVLEEEEEEQVFEDSKCKDSELGEEECISPNEVLVLVSAEGEGMVIDEGEETICARKAVADTQLVWRRKSVSSLSNGNARLHPQATSSESEEEIDVVTISDRPEKIANRQEKLANHINVRQRTTSLSAPCSRQPSPSHMLPNKKRRYHSKRTHRLSSVGSNYGDGLESDDEQRRASHNVLERKRRNDLKYSFQILRGQIPELKDNQRAPKVTILRKAADYIKQIREEEEDLQTRMAKERKRESKLLQRLAYLKSLA